MWFWIAEDKMLDIFEFVCIWNSSLIMMKKSSVACVHVDSVEWYMWVCVLVRECIS